MTATERRRDPLSGREVLIAPGRAGVGAPRRPAELPTIEGRCPFCPGNEVALLDDLASLVVDGAPRLAAITREAAYNLVLREPALDAGPGLGFHIELLPRLDGDAGFELGIGSAIVVVPPEESARAARALCTKTASGRGETD